MDYIASIFDIDLANDTDAANQGKRATAAALARCRQRFGSFLQGSDGHEIAARFDLIEMDLKQVVADVVSEYGGDVDNVEASVTSVLAAGGFCDDCRKWKSGPKAGCTCGTSDGGSSDDDDSEGDIDKEAASGGTFRDKVARYGYCPACESPGQLVGKLGNRDHYQCSNCGSDFSEFDTHPGVTQAPAAAPQSVGPPSPVMARWNVVGEALETEKLPDNSFGSDPWSHGPSPQIDKKDWKPNALNDEGNLKPIDTEGAGSPHPTEHHDISRSTDHTRDFKEQTNAVTEQETLKGTDSVDGAGFNGDKNQTQYPTRTFGDKGQQPSGVGDEAFPKKSNGHGNFSGDMYEDDATPDDESEILTRQKKLQRNECPDCGYNVEHCKCEEGQHTASGDPDKNPIRESLRAEHGVLPESDLQAAISAFKS